MDNLLIQTKKMAKEKFRCLWTWSSFLKLRSGKIFYLALYLLVWIVKKEKKTQWEHVVEAVRVLGSENCTVNDQGGKNKTGRWRWSRELLYTGRVVWRVTFISCCNWGVTALLTGQPCLLLFMSRSRCVTASTTMSRGLIQATMIH